MSHVDRSKIHETIREFLIELNKIDPTYPRKKVLESQEITGEEVGSKPEEFTIEKIIRPILSDGFSLSYKGEPYIRNTSNWPDFEIDASEDVLGENKPINKHSQAVADIKDYIKESGRKDTYGIATDGIEWSVHQKKLGDSSGEYVERGRVDITPLFKYHGVKLGYFGNNLDGSKEDLEKEAQSCIDNLNELLSFEGDSEEGSDKKVEELFDQYSELVFGKDGIVNRIDCHESINKSQKEEFAVNFVNRVLFIKHLQDTDVIKENFLQDLIENNTAIGGIYDSQLKPVFREVLDEPKQNRRPQLKQGPTAEIPYVNGGLFDIKSYENNIQVPDSLVKHTVNTLKTGDSSDAFDPDILGDVFEELTNKLANEESKSDAGAFYTPDDLTDHIISEVLHPKIKKIIVDNYSSTEQDKGILLEEDYGSIVDNIKYGTERFSSKNPARETIRDLKQLKIADIACGSGHFLTALMEELSELVLLLEKICQGGSSLSDEQRFNHKRDIAVNCLYGVDISGVAVEIAKFRIWFKLIEDISLNEINSTLPNIDLNIKQGNSLVGIPFTSMSDDNIRTSEINLDELLRIKSKYISGELDAKEEFITSVEDNSRILTSDLMKKLNEKKKLSSVSSISDWKNFIELTDKDLYKDTALHETIDYIKVSDKNSNKLSESQRKNLESKGYNVNKKSARLDIKSRDIQQKHTSKLKIITQELEFLEQQENLKIETIKRRITEYDIDSNMSGDLFHWPLHFPEVSNYSKGSYTLEFDLMVGNPPYGDSILSDSERKILGTYSVGDISEISGYFIERQKQLTDQNTIIGNVLPESILVNKNTKTVRDYIRQYIRQSKMAFYGTRPAKVFNSADKRVITLFTNSDIDLSNKVYVSDMKRFTKNERPTLFENTQYSHIDDLVLEDIYYPKVGDDRKRSLLLKINSLNTLSDYTTTIKGGEKYTLDYRRSGRYWLQALKEFPYTNTKIQTLSFESSLERNAAQLIFNSSLFYMFWASYGNGRDLNNNIVTSMPMPKQSRLRKFRQEIDIISDRLEEKLLDCFNPNSGRTGEFNTSEIREFIDILDLFVCQLLGIEEYNDYVQNYHREIRS